ncbi:RedB protein [Planctomycetes bacterium TBK1r]|uniref:RedB protein n=1 Tax=Stieleria magnilauensis TaxID=2527963 RepID=A0ABX5XYK0_9BACT|nr:hypothetical protein TBK1r_61410 [Planctomycetes bacterium TBK1r]
MTPRPSDDRDAPAGQGTAFDHVARRPGGWTIPVLVIAWSVMVAAGLGIVWRYEHTAGPLHVAPDRWPSDSQIERSPERWTLVLFAHPKCPCTRATLGELARIMTQCADRVQASALFVKPPACALEPGWEYSQLWQAAEQIPDLSVYADPGGVEANRFAAVISGLVLLYDPAGRLRFRGGITASRGHSGDNLGRSTIVQLLNQGSGDVDSTKVYGCELGTNLQETHQSCHQP